MSENHAEIAGNLGSSKIKKISAGGPPNGPLFLFALKSLFVVAAFTKKSLKEVLKCISIHNALNFSNAAMTLF